MAFIIPFRDRSDHLAYFLHNIIPILKRQQLKFRFIVVEQVSPDLFNKGRLHNAGFEFAQSLGVNCVVFHDVDMIPLDDRNTYGYPRQPRHVAPYTDTLNYELWYHNLVGGVLSMKTEHYVKLNGFSNEYWGWGGEDDDMGKRILGHGMAILRPHRAVGRYTMLQHKQRSRAKPVRKILSGAAKRWKTDGLNSCVWNVTNVEQRKLFYHLNVNVGKVPDSFKA